MKKLLALIALFGLVAMDAEARRRGCGTAKCEPCEVQCDDCPPCDRPAECEMIELGESVKCAKKPVCKITSCVEPKKICRRRTIVECKWQCPTGCAEFMNEGAADQHTERFMNGDGSKSGY